jgi:ribosomal protein S18 acetylase RimI-like enzyme
VQYREKGFLKEMEKGEPENIIAFHAGKPAGLLSYGKSRYADLPKTTVELWRIYMAPGLQGVGLGKELLEFGMREMSAKGYSKVILCVLEGNMRARKFYEKNGFSQKGVTMDAYYGMDITDLMYEKILTPADAAGTWVRSDDKNSVDLV